MRPNGKPADRRARLGFGSRSRRYAISTHFREASGNEQERIVMSHLIDTKIDDKNIGLLKNLWRLRQALDVYCLIAANGDGLSKRGGGKNFFYFLRTAFVQLIAIDICKIYEKESRKRKTVRYELNSIDGVLGSFAGVKANVLEAGRITSFVRKYGNGQGEDETVLALSLAVDDFEAKYHAQLMRFKTFRDKWAAHSEYKFNPEDLPSYDIMERLFNFGMDFYMLVSRAFTGAGPLNLNDDRRVKASLKGILKALGLEEIRNEME